MDNRGFTRQELHDIFYLDLDLDRPEDRATIAALQASSSRQRYQARPPLPARRLRSLVMQRLAKPTRRLRQQRTRTKRWACL